MKATLKYFAFTWMIISGSTFAMPPGETPSRYRVIAVSKTDHQIESVSNEVVVEPDLAVYIPNAFTPNGDGLNDLFGVVGEGFTGFRMEVFNRWGELIFESHDQNEMWDGTYRGRAVPSGVYVYRVVVVNTQSEILNKNGTVTLVK